LDIKTYLDKGAVMYRFYKFSCIFVLFLVCIASPYVSAADKAVEGMLPSSGFFEGWAMEGKETLYKPDNLYMHINGEAELYMPYGFEVLATALFVNISSQNIALVADVYKMGSLLDAYGIYSYNRNPDAEIVRIGSEGFINESQLMFYQDRYFVRLSASGNVTPERAVFISCGESMAKKISGRPSQPEELEFLKTPGVIPHTERYIAKSVLGYPFFEKGLTAEANLDGEPVRVFVILNESEKTSERALDQYIIYLKEAGIQPQLDKSMSGKTLTVQDPMYKGMIIQQSGRFLTGVTNLKDPKKGILLIDRLQAIIKKP
jgi:hypothetical protein